MADFEAQAIKKDFKIFQQKINDEPLVYLDNAATTQKPKQVLDRVLKFYEEENSNVHRSVHTLASRATIAYENARTTVARFINANSIAEVIFTRGTTTSFNFLATSLAEFINPDDEIVISIMEHHANVLPWQRLARQKGAKLKYLELKDGKLDLDYAEQVITNKTKIVSITHISNVLGIVNPIEQLIKLAHQQGAIFILDAAQSVPHQQIDVQKLDLDFMCFSGHKMLAPTGIGILFGKEKLLAKLSPVELGGEMISSVSRTEAKWKELPWKFEAGTPNIAGAIGLASAIDYLSVVGLEQVARHQRRIVNYLLPKLTKIDDLILYGNLDPTQHSAIFSFNIGNLHPHDVATAFDMEGVAVRAGHHCAEPLITDLKIKNNATVRASFYIYNTKADCDKFVETILATKEFFHGSLI